MAHFFAIEQGIFVAIMMITHLNDLIAQEYFLGVKMIRIKVNF